MASLRKNEAFVQFFKKGHRKNHEPVPDYIARRENEYQKLVELNSTTQLSEDLRAFFLLDMVGVSESEHLRLLGQAGNEYDLKKIISVMEIQLAHAHRRPVKPTAYGNKKGNRGGKGASPSDEEGQESEEDAGFAAPVGPFEPEDYYEGYFDAFPVDDGDDAFANDAVELECCFVGKAPLVDELDADGIEAFAMQAQALGKRSYTEARQRLNTTRRDRGHGLKAKFTGKRTISFEDKDAKHRLDEIKKVSRCSACGEIGHWAGDVSRPHSQ